MVTFELKILRLDRVRGQFFTPCVGRFQFFFILLKLGFVSFDFFLKSTNYGLWLQVHYASTTFWLGSSINPNQS